MYRKLICFISFAVVLGLAGNVTLVNADTTWTGADPGDDLWSTAANWSEVVPDEADVVTIASPPRTGTGH